MVAVWIEDSALGQIAQPLRCESPIAFAVYEC